MDPGIAISLDGLVGVEVLSTEDRRRVDGRFVEHLPIRVRLQPLSDPVWMCLSVSTAWLESYKAEWFGWQLQLDAATEELAYVAVGEYLDQAGVPARADDPDKYVATVDLSEILRRLRDRPPADDEQIRLCLGSMLYWSSCFRWPRLHLREGDLLRLKTTRRDFLLVARRDDDRYWTQVAMGGVYEPTSQLISEFEQGIFPYQVPRPLFQVQKVLSSRRYDAARYHFGEALENLRSTRPNPAVALKQAIDAVESIAKVVTGLETETLGGCIAHLRKTGRLRRPLDKALEAVNGFRGSSPGIGHGGTSIPSLELSESKFVLNLAAAAILFLAEIDAPTGSNQK